MKENNKKTYRVDNLAEGTAFEMPGLQETMKNLKLVSTSDCSSLVEGLKRDSQNEAWKPFRYHISNSVMVTLADSNGDIKVNTKQPSNSSVRNPDVKRGRGRPKKSKPIFKNLIGIDSAFSVKEISEKNNLKDYEAVNLIKDAINLGVIVESGEQKIGRGKPRKMYKLI
jgi:hypothetical protein